MAYDLAAHPFFRAWADPISGAVSHVLTEQAAPVQYSLPSPYGCISRDERWLWIACAHPPNPQPSLAAVCLDPEDAEIRHFPRAGFSGAAPLVAPEGDAVYFCCGRTAYRMDVDGHLDDVCHLDADYVGGRELRRLATYCSLSADGRYLLFDGRVGDHSFVALGDLASGQAQVVREFQAHHGNAQFAPDGQHILLAQLPLRDTGSGVHLEADLRLHLMALDGSGYRCLTPTTPREGGRGICFEWWGDDNAIHYVERRTGVWRIDPETELHDQLWPEPLCHADAHHQGRYLCADRDPAQWRNHPMAVMFYDREANRGLDIDSGMPTPIYPRRQLPVAPVPRFSPRGSWVVYTTTRGGGIDVALCPTRELREEVARQPALEAEFEAGDDEQRSYQPRPVRRRETTSSGTHPTWGGP